MNIEEIGKLKTRYFELYEQTRKEQNEDQSYNDDTFKVPEIRSPHVPLRSGLGRIMVDAPAEQIVTSNPQVFIHTDNKERAKRLSSKANEWFSILKRQNPNPFKESVKNKLLRGESLIMVVHNELWVTGKNQMIGLPVLFPILDPMVIYSSPEEDDNGIPERVIVFYERQLTDIITGYPQWTNPKGRGTGRDKRTKVEWFAYTDKDIRYFEADGEPVLKGEIQDNIYKVTPFVRKYSGFGRRSPDGELSNLIMSDIRYSRGLIKEYCIMASDIASVMHLAAHKSKTFMTTGGINEDNIRENLSFGEYDINVLQNIPTDFKYIPEVGDIEPPTAEAFTHLSNIYSRSVQRNPFIIAGSPQGTSGRQQDLAYIAAMRRYDTVIENTENEWATAIEMAFKILKEVPTLAEKAGVNKADLEAQFRCEVKLKASDPIEEDRLATLGDRLWKGGKGCIGLKRLHTQFLGMTENEHEDEVAEMLVDMLTVYNPDVAAVMGMEFAEKAGMEKYFAKLQQKQATQGQGASLMTPASPTEQLRTQGEVQSPQGTEQATMRGARVPPEGY